MGSILLETGILMELKLGWVPFCYFILSLLCFYMAFCIGAFEIVEP